MKTMLKLALTIFKGSGFANFSGDAKRKRKRFGRVGSIILFAFLGVYMVSIMTAASLGLYNVLAPVGLQSLMISIFLSAAMVVTFLFGLLYVISIFYHTSDIEKLLPLPLRAEQIIGAKLLVTATYEYIFVLGMLLPSFLVYGIRSGAGPLYYLYALLVIIILPQVPLCMAAVLSMLIMRFTKFARNKDRFSLWAGILAMVAALGVSYAGQSMINLSSGKLVELLSKGAGEIAGLTAIFFPGTAQAAQAIADPTGLAAAGQMGLVILFSAIAVTVTMLLARLLYFKGVVGMGTSGSVSRKVTARDYASARGRGSAFWTYVMKDFRILVRTPIFFMNNVLMNFLWPVFFLIPILINQDDSDISGLISMLNEAAFQTDSPGTPLALGIAFAIMCFVAGTNGIAESALSREGRQFYLMKILPMSYNRQILAKVTVGILMSLVGAGMLVLVLSILIQPPLWFILLILSVMPGAILTSNLSGIIFELYWPKLTWDNEQKAVKQNLNVFFGILVSTLLAALVVAPIIVFDVALLTAFFIACAAPLAVSAILALLVRRLAPRLMLSIEA